MRTHFEAEFREDRGVALLLALFAMLLVSAVGVAILFLSSGESTIVKNQRVSAQVWQVARAGLEEARARLRTGDLHYVGNANIPSSTTKVLYIVNPAGAGDSVVPNNSANAYFDSEYQKEWGQPITSVTLTVNTINSDMQTLLSGGILSVVPAYKWVRVTARTEASVNQPVSGGSPLNNTIPVSYDGARQNLTSTGGEVYDLTALAVLPDGTQRMLKQAVAPDVPITVTAAIQTKGDAALGDALNVTGTSDPVPACGLPDTDGVKSQGTITNGGSGNVTGSPYPTEVKPFLFNLTAMLNNLGASALPIDGAGTGVTGSGSPTSYSGPHATLGTPPTVTYDAAGAVTSITAPGTAKTYLSNGNLTLGTRPPAGTKASGQGVLLVKGNLTIDITNGFDYFGLILVTGDITMTADPATSATSNIHGAIIGGGKFTGNLSSLSGSIFIHQNACLFMNQFNTRPLHLLAFREITE